MIVRIDARRLTSAAALHAVLDEAFGFAEGYGKNLDALVDCLTHLDDPKASLTRLRVFPGQVVLLAVEHAASKSAAQVKSLSDVSAFVNWRRMKEGRPPVLAIAHEAV